MSESASPARDSDGVESIRIPSPEGHFDMTLNRLGAPDLSAYEPAVPLLSCQPASPTALFMIVDIILDLATSGRGSTPRQSVRSGYVQWGELSVAIAFEDRPSDSSDIERVWRSHSDAVDRMTSIATAHWTLVAWRAGPQWRVAVQGPETGATTAPIPPETEFVGIRLSLGTALERLPGDSIVDHGIEFPDVSRHSVRIFGHTVPLPGYEGAEDLVQRLVRVGVIVRDPMVGDVLRGWPPDATTRTIRRHFLSATGLTPGVVRQIERAREAAMLIRTGAPIAAVAHDLGYYDQPHLARSLDRFIGHTATELRNGACGQLSLLYKT